MLIREFTEEPDLDGVDLVDDLHFFMHNDPKFYRRVLYPLISKLRTHVKKGKKCKDEVFRNCVEQAIAQYCKQYNISGNPTSVFTNVDRDSLARKIFNDEMNNINSGAYDGRERNKRSNSDT